VSRISELGEFGFLDKLLPTLRGNKPGVRIGPGDDACVVEPAAGTSLVATTDMLIEEVHFRLDWQSPEELGWKAIAANFSDIAAMGARPAYVLVCLGCPGSTEESFLDALYRGMRELCEQAEVQIVGGDTTRADKLVLSITALGLCGPAAPVPISGARVGQAIYATACPGLSGLGLRLLEHFGRSAVPAHYSEALQAHVRPQVPWRMAPEIARHLQPGAMTDLSDGLARDIGKICHASGVGAWIDFYSLSWHKELVQAQEEFGWDRVDFALAGGEDYCLIFTADRPRLEEQRRLSPALAKLVLFELGEITPQERGFVGRWPDGSERLIEPRGFDHFGPEER